MGHHIRGFIARQDDLRKAAMSLPGTLGLGQHRSNESWLSEVSAE